MKSISVAPGVLCLVAEKRIFRMYIQVECLLYLKEDQAITQSA